MNNLTPAQTQFLATIGPLVGVIAGYFAAWKGIDAGALTGIILAAIGLVFAVMNFLATRRNTVVSQVANMPEVKEIVLNKNDPATPAMDAATPNNVITK